VNVHVFRQKAFLFPFSTCTENLLENK